MDNGAVQVGLDMVLNVVVIPGIEAHPHGCRPLWDGFGAGSLGVVFAEGL